MKFVDKIILTAPPKHPKKSIKEPKDKPKRHTPEKSRLKLPNNWIYGRV